MRAETVQKARQWRQLHRGGLPIAEIGRQLGVSRQHVSQALKDLRDFERYGRSFRRARSVEMFKPTLPSPAFDRTWCSQCERNVLTVEADRCSSKWCKGKAALRGAA